jgi:starvation-inducible DNA-binding protein
METESKTVITTEVKPNIGLAEKDRSEVARTLNTILADEYVLYTKTRNYHWNVTGPQFHELHEFFGKQYEQLDEIVDDVAERARQLGGESDGTLSEFLKSARIKEHPDENPDARTMISNLLEDHEAVIRNLRMDADATADKYHDMGTNDFLIGLMEQHEKMAWMLRSFLDGSHI